MLYALDARPTVRRTCVNHRYLAPGLYLILALGLVLDAPPARSAAPCWPLDLETRFLTSNFMERRPGRWHAGLDFKTETVSGFPVRAVEAGWISRVRAEAGAYGRAVYLVGDSGKTYVYAHLEQFSDVIHERVAADRARHGRYRVRLNLDEGDLRVAAGQVLGLSGQSGAEGPHLHFEVRDARQHPLNPLDQGFAVPDTFPPLITGVTAHCVRPSAGSGAVANGIRDPAGLHGDLAPLVITGPVAFSAAISDRSDIRGHVLEPGVIEVRLDGTLVYRCRNESFDFGDNSQQRLEWCDFADRDGRRVIREHWLHRRAEVALPGRDGGLWYLGAEGAGLTVGEHLLEIVAEDLAGGRCSVRIPLQVKSGDGGTSQVAGWQEADVVLRPAPDIVLSPFFALHPRDDAAIQVLEPVRGDPVLARTVIWSRTSTTPVPGVPSLDWQGLYLAADWPLDGNLRVAVDRPPAAPGAWIFRRGRKGWQPVGPLHRDGRSAWFLMAEPGFHAAFLDLDPPVIGPARVAVEVRTSAVVPGVTRSRWQVFAVAVEEGDVGVGVDPATIGVSLDGAPLIAEPDLIRDRILVTVPDATVSGLHVLTVEATDQAGNRATATIEVICAPPGP